jgi:hypothetical protein
MEGMKVFHLLEFEAPLKLAKIGKVSWLINPRSRVYKIP